MKSKYRPDIIIFVMAYLSLLGLGALFGSLIVFFTIIPAILENGPSNLIGVVVMALLGIFSLLLVVPVIFAMMGLWRGTAAGRVISMILTLLAASVSALSIPVLLLVGIWGIALYVPLLTAVFLLVVSGSVLWGLTRQSVLKYISI